jgi:hypothetical protein
MTESRPAARVRITLLAAIAALTLLAVGAAGAQAKMVELAGQTSVTTSAQAQQFLADKGVAVSAVEPAALEGGMVTLPLRFGFGNPKNYTGVLVHEGGLRFSKGERSVVVRDFIAVRGKHGAVLFAKIAGLRRGGCGHLGQVRRQLRQLAKSHPAAKAQVRTALRDLCHDGRVILLAKLTNLGKSLEGTTATLTADLRLSMPAAKLINRRFGTSLRGGALLGSAVSTVTPAG